MKNTVAILQIIPNHHELIPKRLVKAVALLDRLQVSYQLYDLERSQARDLRTALTSLLSNIQESTVIVSMACNNNYPKIDSFVFLCMYWPYLKNKKVVICSSYFSLYDVDSLAWLGFEFVSMEIDDYVKKIYGDPSLGSDDFCQLLPSLLHRLGYDRYRFWDYLTFGCKSQCSFCYNKRLCSSDPVLRYGDPEEVLFWMKLARSMGRTYFEFSEPNFLSDKAFARQFMQRLQREALGVTWRCKTRLDDIDAHIYTQMKESGCRTIFFGVEHMWLSLLRQIRKKEDSGRKLAEFLKYRDPDTTVHLSFLMGIKGEGRAALQDNLEAVLKVGAVHNVEPNIGWQLIYDPKRRNIHQYNYIVPFMAMLNFIPGRFIVSPGFMRDLFNFSLEKPFFSYLFQTESENSLELMQTLVCFLKRHSGQRVIKDFDLLLVYGSGFLTKSILKSRSVAALNTHIMNELKAG